MFEKYTVRDAFWAGLVLMMAIGSILEIRARKSSQEQDRLSWQAQTNGLDHHLVSLVRRVAVLEEYDGVDLSVMLSGNCWDHEKRLRALEKAVSDLETNVGVDRGVTQFSRHEERIQALEKAK